MDEGGCVAPCDDREGTWDCVWGICIGGIRWVGWCDGSFSMVLSYFLVEVLQVEHCLPNTPLLPQWWHSPRVKERVPPNKLMGDEERIVSAGADE